MDRTDTASATSPKLDLDEMMERIRAEVAERKRQAFAAHVSQNNPESPFVTMGDQIFQSAFGSESYVLAGGRLAGRRGESDLFQGVA